MKKPSTMELKRRCTSLHSWELPKQSGALAPDYVWTNRDMGITSFLLPLSKPQADLTRPDAYRGSNMDRLEHHGLLGYRHDQLGNLADGIIYSSCRPQLA